MLPDGRLRHARICFFRPCFFSGVVPRRLLGQLGGFAGVAV